MQFYLTEAYTKIHESSFALMGASTEVVEASTEANKTVEWNVSLS